MRKWNKLLALLLAMSMVLGMATTAFAASDEDVATEPVGETTEETETPAPEETPAEEPAAEAGYTDVTEANWYYEAVTYVTENGLVDGATETTFAPSAEMTRAALAVALYRMAGSPEVTAENPFTDVSAEDDYYNAVLWAYTNGIVTGMTETTFGVDSTLQRQQIATMLYRYAENVTAAPAEDEVVDAPADETTEPADETTEPADETTEPADETTEPADETAEPADETTEPADETAEPADETAEPADETAEPADETAEPADETAEPADETAEPADETAEPADETAEPADEPAEEDVLAQFADADLVQAYAKEAMTWAVEAGLFAGDANGALNPRGYATRAEVATLLMRFAAMIAPAEAPEDAIGGADAETDIAVTDGEETTEPAEGETETAPETETTEPTEGEETTPETEGENA